MRENNSQLSLKTQSNFNIFGVFCGYYEQRKSKMEKISSKKLVEILQSKSQPLEVTVSEVVTDSRIVKEGDLFIALKGDKFDAHNFVPQVMANGAALAVVEHLVAGVPENRQIVVESTVHAFGQIGAYNRSLFKGKVIGLTGSAGKTTTKEEIKFLLSLFGKTYATTGNHNNQIGVPRSLCDIDMSADFAVIEMGMSAKGEIERLVSYVQPDMAVVTNVYPMHIEFFPNFEAIAEAKAEIFTALKPHVPALINEDTNFANILRLRAQQRMAKVYGFGKYELFGGQGATYKANIQGTPVEFSLSDNAEHYLYNALCALNVVALLGLDVKKAAAEVKNFGALAGRGKVSRLKFGGGSFELVDDSYSGQPEAMKLAIKSLDSMPCQGRKIAVLGKMAELGDTSEAQHIAVGKVLADTKIDIVIGVCPETKKILEQLKDGRQTFYFENKDGLTDFLLNKLLQNNDIVLIKGARYSSKLYQVADDLLKQGN